MGIGPLARRINNRTRGGKLHLGEKSVNCWRGKSFQCGGGGGEPSSPKKICSSENKEISIERKRERRSL